MNTPSNLMILLFLLTLVWMLLGLVSPRISLFFLKPEKRSRLRSFLLYLSISIIFVVLGGVLQPTPEERAEYMAGVEAEQVEKAREAAIQAEAEQAAKAREEALKEYHSHPVTKGKKALQELEEIEKGRSPDIVRAIAEMTAIAKGERTKVDTDIFVFASLACNDLAEEYKDHTIDENIPPDTKRLLVAAKGELAECYVKLTNIMLGIQKAAEGDSAYTLKQINEMMQESTALKLASAEKLKKAAEELDKMPAPSLPE
jgi:hypothetical protein